MSAVTIIELEGNPVGLVADGHARINEGRVVPGALPTVKAMALFAMEVQDGHIEGPYTESRALAYAKQANRQHPTVSAHSPIRPGRG